MADLQPDGGGKRLPGFFPNLLTILHKNWMLKRKKRGNCSFVSNGVLAEILLPSLIFVALIPVWKVVDTTDKPDELFNRSVDIRGFYSGTWYPPCDVTRFNEWRDDQGRAHMQQVPQAVLNFCDTLVRNPKCTRNTSNPDPRLAGLPACQPICPGTTPCQDPAACFGDLCLQIGSGPSGMAECSTFILYPFAYDKSFYTKSFLDGVQCGFDAAPINVPDFDTVALIRKFAGVYPDELVTDIMGDAVKTGYEFAFVSPDGPNHLTEGLNAFMTESANASNMPSIGGTYTFQFVGLKGGTGSNMNEADAVQYAKDDGSTLVWGLVSMFSDTKYDIRFNNTCVPETKSKNKLFVSKGLGEDFPLYIKSGFLTVQQIVNDYLMKVARGTQEDVHVAYPWVTPMPLVSYTENPFLSLVGGFLAFFMAVVLLYPVSQLVSAMVREKEQRMREVMLIMGLSPTAFRVSWFLTSALQMLCATLIGTLVLKVSYLEKADYFLLLVIFTLYFWSVTALAILIASFFSKAQLASVAGPVVFFATVIVGQSIPEDVGSGTMNAVSIFSTYPFTQAMTLVSNYEAAEIGIKWEHLYTDSPYSLSTALIWLTFDLVAYMFLAWYVDNVLPQEWGTPQHPLFIFFPSYWCPRSTEKRGNTRDTRAQSRPRSRHATNECIEDIPPEMLERRRVEIQHMRKEFKLDDGSKMIAVNDIRLDMFEGQIQALLGHNGAGKTTTINMLTGMMPIDGGDAIIYDHSAKTQMPLVRADVGLCPQHNVLWPTLTCAEHLRFYARLKGVPKDRIEAAVDQVLVDVELDDKKDVNSDALSGGMKRKLSVAITLVGDCRFCIFDEPTAGMDVQARRAIWDLLKRSKEGRTILLTTHFMDEADLLGDSIAIMHKGLLPYWGSSLFLKSRLGVGYSLRLDYQGEDRRRPDVQALIDGKLNDDPGSKEHIQCISDAGKELAYRLPLSATKKFGELFRALESDEAREMGIMHYSVGVTTLEEIFLKIAQDDIEQELDEDDMSEGPSPMSSPVTSPKADGDPAKEALLGGHRVEAGRGWEVPAEALMTDQELYNSQWRGLLRKRFNNYKRDKKLLCCQLLLPVILISIACGIDQIPTSDPPALDLVKYDQDDPTLFPISPPAGNPAGYFEDFPTFGFTKQGITAATVSAFDNYLWHSFNLHKDDDRYQGFFQDTTSGVNTTMFHNSSNAHSTAISMNSLASARASKIAGQSVTIDARNYPLPLSTYSKNVLQGVQTVSKVGLIYAPFTFVPSVFAGFLVLERVRKAKLVQLVSGVRPSAYWASNYLFDLFLYCITILLGVIVLAMFGRDEYTSVSQGHLPATVLLLLFYGFAGIGVSYFASFYFQNHTTAQNMLLLGNFLPATILLTVTTILQLISSTRSVGEALLFVFRLFPAFCLGEGLQALALRELYNTLGYGNTGPFAVCNGYGCNGVGTALIYLAIETPIIFLAILFLEKPELLTALGLRRRSDDTDPRATHMVDVEDDDVSEERRQVESGQRDQDLVVVKRLMHEYPARGGVQRKMAVKGLSFAVPDQEIFGFLGTNGAGKTTTISIMAGEFVSTSGSVTIAGHDIVGDTEAARQQIGYCPQFDALLDLLTPKETIDFYCSLRGIPLVDRERVTQALLKDLGLRSHQDKMCKSLSGGNKRKTSICISLVGGPAVVLLDEPTAGMDPAARRALWNSLKKVGHGRCVVLTTHHLEEVEALAQRVAIMVSGRLECLGSLQRLKDKFGKGYQMEVKMLDSAAVDKIRQFVSEQFSGQAELTEEAGLRLTFQLPKGLRPLSEIFDLIESGKERLGIVDYAIQQTSLEQVFMAICRQHLEGDGAEGDASPDGATEQPARDAPAFTGAD
eukprot:TRINITY_DN1242_c0_g1_i1.p1 TRINITY_DN1242_c0_g1~~TRINITY_DN1242_c0_g1_i1.p1  ORF type:complete len:1877 (+),score=682.06 TRINITY_DN1242_c0_g1_i1:64-5631(+)